MNILLLTEKFRALQDYAPESYEIHFLTNKLQLSLLLRQLDDYEIVTYSIVLGEIEKIQKEQYKQEINKLKEQKEKQKEVTLYTPKGMLSPFLNYQFSIKELDFNFILEDNNINIYTIPINEEFFQLHKIQCILKPYISNLLFYIISKPKFLVRYLEQFVLLHQATKKIGYYIKEDRMCTSIEEGLIILESNQWIIDRNKLQTNLNKHNNITSHYVDYCNCNYISYKSIANQFHFPLKESELVIHPIAFKDFETRELILPLKKEIEISNPFEFYKLHVLKCVGKSDYKKSLKPPKLHIKKRTNQLIVKY